MAERRFAGLMLTSHFFPVVGGALAYLSRRDDDPELARILFAGTFIVPIQFVGAVVAEYAFSHMFAGILGGIVTAVVAAGAVSRIMRDNYYNRMYWAFALGPIGAIYVYAGPYREDTIVRETMVRFAVGEVLFGSVAGRVFSMMIGIVMQFAV